MSRADAYYPQFENRFLNAKGDAFQTFFEELMGRARVFIFPRKTRRGSEIRNSGNIRLLRDRGA